MTSPNDYRFSETHEWLHREGDLVILGITQYAADELTDVTYVELKPAGSTIGAGEPVGEVESVKTTTDIYTPVGGEIIEVNPAVTDDPSLLNSDPYRQGWLIKIRAADLGPLDELMDQSTYDRKFPVST